jgi:nitrate/TMAO reductase-like tetraheme cytochrome c subunit
MKNLKLVGSLIILVSGLMFTQCTTDTLVGPPGADGINGIDGIDGVDGLDGIDGLDGASAAVCISCHSNTHRDPIYASYDMSKHSKGETLAYAGARASCSRCHSNEGYVDLMTRGSVNPAGYYGLSEPKPKINDNDTPDDESDDFVETGDFGEVIYSNNPVPVVSPISCTTCHGSHKSFDFENDGNDFALRGLDPITLITDGTVIDFGNKSNVCVSCHQPRRLPPTDPNGTGSFFISSSHWGPHHGPQATLYEGIQGAEVSGSVAYPAVASSTHRQEASCTSCHMTPATEGESPSHAMIPSENACISCHSSVPTEVVGLEADMNTLGQLLEAAGALHFDGEEWHPVKGSVSIQVAKAAWNFLLVYEDMSKGVHNPAYAKALISNSIESF